jgi:hypothetical protein
MKDQMGGHIASMGEMRNVYKILVEKLEEKRPLGEPGCRWTDNIKMDSQEIECMDVEQIHLRDSNSYICSVKV